MTLRMLAGALALALMSAVTALARSAYARVMCAGTYVTIVNVPDPREDAQPAVWPPRPVRRASEGVPHADASAGGACARHGGGARASRDDHPKYLGDGRALVYDASSGGHLTRVHVVSLRGYRIRDPRGA